MAIYTNKLNLDSAILDKDNILNRIYNKYAFNEPLTRVQMLGLYVYPYGRMVDLANHEEIDVFLLQEGIISLVGENPYQMVQEGSQFMDACNCLRIRWNTRTELAWVMLPENQLSTEQYNTLTTVLDTILYTNTHLVIFSLDNSYSKNYGKEYFDCTDDIIKEIRRFYVGKGD